MDIVAITSPSISFTAMNYLGKIEVIKINTRYSYLKICNRHKKSETVTMRFHLSCDCISLSVLGHKKPCKQLCLQGFFRLNFALLTFIIPLNFLRNRVGKCATEICIELLGSVFNIKTAVGVRILNSSKQKKWLKNTF